MKRTFVVLVAALTVVGTVPAPAAASNSLSITDVSLPDSVTQGDSFDLEVSVSGSDLQNDAVDVSLTLPNGLSCSPTGTQTVTLSSGTGSAVFDCDADVGGDYTGEITVSASATAASSGDSDPDTQSTQAGLNVLSPASLTLSTSLDASSIDEGASTTLTAVVHNAGDASANYDLSPPSSGGYSTSLASGTATGTVAGGATKTVEYTVTGNSDGGYTLTTQLSGNGQTISESEQLSVEGSGGGTYVSSSSDSSTTETPSETTATPAPAATDTPSETETETATPGEGAPSVDTPTTDELTGDGTPTVAMTEMGTRAAPTETAATAEPTATATPDGENATDAATDSAEDGPGFGVVPALAAVLALVLLGRRD